MPNLLSGKFKTRIVFLWLGLLLGLALAAPATQAAPAKGTSAYAAARLKNHPPKNWIRHYLGDDRYKIAGGIWKVVSTELDRYYYPAWAPEMLKQPAGIVLGFNSVQEAEEAGYLPSAYPMGESLYGLSPAEIAAARNRNVVVKPVQGKKVILADGVSSIILPSGWQVLDSKRMPENSNSIASNLTTDLLVYNNNVNQSLIIMTSIAPRSMNLQREMSAESIRRNIAKALKNPKVDQSVKDSLAKSKIRSYRLGGLPGYIQHDPDGQSTGATVAIIASRGQKLYWFQMAGATEKAPGLYAIVNSFQPR